MLVTVAICTWNRSALLDQTLTRLHDLVVPDGTTWELLVVNNNCTDDTDAVLARHATALPLRRLWEPKPGHSNARNCAVDATRGELLIWTDDDVLVDPNWLVEYVNAAAKFPAAGYFGGTVDPWFAETPPRWLSRNLDLLGGPFAIRQFGPEVRPFVGTEAPYGANMAFRTAAMKGHRFDPQLGRTGTGMLSGDETELVARIRAESGPGIWVGPAIVQHYIPPDRMTARYAWKFFNGMGRTGQRMQPVDRSAPFMARMPRWAIRQYAVARFKAFMFFPFASRIWLKNFIIAATTRGLLEECRANTKAFCLAQ